jgi:hypothetical protein
VPTLADLVASYSRTPTASCYLDGRRWYGVQKLAFHQKFGESIATGIAEGRDPPTTPRIGMSIRWTWGYNGVERAGFTGEIAGFTDSSYPDRWSLQCKDMLWRADKSSQVLQTSPLNDIAASDAARYLLTTYGGIASARLSLPSLPASGSAWGGSEWILGKLTPVQWGDPAQESGGTSALKAAAEIYACLGYWLYADAGGTVRAKQMERKPSPAAREVFRRDLNLLINGAPERQQSYDNIYNQVTVRGANTGVLGVQLWDQYRTSSPLLQAGVYRDFSYSSFLLEYENESEAGAASITAVTKRILNVVSRIPDVVPLRAKADPARAVGDTAGIVDTGILIPTQRNFFIYQIDREWERQSGRFDDRLLLDGGVGSTGYTTIPPPDASFTYELMRETLDGVDVVEVALDGSASSSPSGEIFSYAWVTSTPTYGTTSDTATGVKATLIFEAADSPAEISLTVVDTTSKSDTEEQPVDLTGADSVPPFQEVVNVAAGASWYATPDGGGTWNVEASGDAVAVGIIGAGADDRAPGTAPTYGLLATRGAAGAGGLRQTLDVLTTASTPLVNAGSAITSNIWVNEGNPARVWFAVGTAVYRSIDGGVTKTAMAAAPDVVTWIMEDAAVENSVFVLSGADMLNATDPTIGWAMLYPGPVGAIARQFVRSRDGQVTWICYSDAPAGESLQRVENGAAADWGATDCRTLALDRQASSLIATVYGITADDPAQIWSFDGLTGLSAAQSTQLFPAGATVQHMLHSRVFDVIYTADFNSIGAGQGALRKYFPLADVLLLWKQLAGGEQGHMLGLGGPNTPTQIEIIELARGATGAADRLFHWTPATLWQSIALPAANKYWFKVVANPFDPDKWLLLGNSNTSAAYSGGDVTMADGTPCLWLTEDAGATWAPITLPDPSISPVNILDLEWSQTNGDDWFIAAQNNATTTALWRGTGATAASPVKDTTTTAYLALVPGLEDEVYFAPSAGGGGAIKGIYVNGSNVWTVPAGSGIATNAPDADYVGLTRKTVVAANSSFYVTDDYRTAQPTSSTSGLGSSVAYCNGVVFSAGLGIVKVANPFTAPAVTQETTNTIVVDPVRSDRQTQTRAAAKINTSTSIYVYDGATWLTLLGPTDADLTAVSPYIEVIVRA